MAGIAPESALFGGGLAAQVEIGSLFASIRRF
jgi:hypothetical protein